MNNGRAKDLTGQKFGRLTALYPLKRTSKDNRIIWYCKCDCGGYKKVQGKMLTNGRTISCGCANSKGEVKVREILIEANINFEEQKEYNNLKASSGNCYKFDFYLPDYNCCIEYDGIQHFETTGWQDEDGLKKTKERDRIKNQYCKDNNIRLIRIPYTDFNILDEGYILKRLEE